MISEDIVSKICIERGMNRMNISSVPTWIDVQKQEGIEFRITGVHPFWVKDGDRLYDEPPSTYIAETIKLITGFGNGNPKEKKCDFESQEKKEKCQIPDQFRTEQSPERSEGAEKCKSASELAYDDSKSKFVNQLVNVFEGKQIIVPQNIEELKQMSTFDRMLLFQRTPARLIKEKKGRGGMQKYVEGHTMKLEAWLAFLGQVSSKIDGWHIDDKAVACYGSITVNIDGQSVTVAGCGIDLQEYTKADDKPVFTVAELMKNACTDMKKKILADMGFNRDVYSGVE